MRRGGEREREREREERARKIESFGQCLGGLQNSRRERRVGAPAAVAVEVIMSSQELLEMDRCE